jgi:hypothetical protein
MAGRTDGPSKQTTDRLSRGPWNWRWRRRRRRRLTGCLLWLVTLLLVLLVLSLLFGGFRKGARTGGGQARTVPAALLRPAPAQAAANSAAANPAVLIQRRAR